MCCTLEQLRDKGLAKELEKGRWIRVQPGEDEEAERDAGDEEVQEEVQESMVMQEESVVASAIGGDVSASFDIGGSLSFSSEVNGASPVKVSSPIKVTKKTHSK